MNQSHVLFVVDLLWYVFVILVQIPYFFFYCKFSPSITFYFTRHALHRNTFLPDLDVTNVTVHVQPPTINVIKSSLSGTSGKSVTLTCSVTSSETVSEVYWQKDGKTKINSSSNTKKYSGCSVSTPSMTILNLEKSDAGSYVCYAKNSGGQSESSAIKLVVSEPESKNSMKYKMSSILLSSAHSD